MILYTENGYDMAKPCNCKQTVEKRMNSRLQFANIPENFKDVKFSNYEVNIFNDEADTKKSLEALKAAQYYVDNFDEMKKDGKGLYFYSACKGSGKTRLALSIANELIEKSVMVKFTTSLQILNEIKNTYNQNNNEYCPSEKRLIEQIISAEVLIIDDFGTEKGSDWVNEKFYDIINGRYMGKKPTIITANYSIDDIKYDERIVDRVREMCYKIPFPNTSIRKLRDLEQTMNFMDKFR